MYIGTYDFQGERLPVLDCFWTAHIVAGEISLDVAENSDFTWLPLAGQPDLAFDTMNRAIAALQARSGHPGSGRVDGAHAGHRST